MKKDLSIVPLDVVDQERSYEFDFTNADRENLKKILAIAKSSLLPQEEYVVNAMFGLTTNGVRQKPAQIAKTLKMTTDRVNRLWVNAKRKLLKDPRLIDYVKNESATSGGTGGGNVGGGVIGGGRPKSGDPLKHGIFRKKLMKRRNTNTNEGLADLASSADMDHEVQMARAELYRLAEYSIKLHNLLKNVSEEEGLEAWVQSKITKAADYIDSVYHHLEYQELESQTDSPMRMPAAEGVDPYKDHLRVKLEEKAKSKKQQRFMGMVYAAKKGEKPASKEVAKVAKGMSKKSAKDFASTKHKGLPNKKSKK